MQLPVRSRGTEVVSIITVVSIMTAKNSKGHHLQIQFRIDILTLSAPVSPIFCSFFFSLSLHKTRLSPQQPLKMCKSMLACGLK